MAYINQGLPNGGLTTYYQIKYDDSLSQVDGVNRATDLMRVCDDDFNFISGWFKGITLTTPLTVQISPGTYASACWGGSTNPSSPCFNMPDSTISLTPGNGSKLDLVRYLLVSEVVEMFMKKKGNGWGYSFGDSNEGSKGEGLSRLLGFNFLSLKSLDTSVLTQGGQTFFVSNDWLDSSRKDFITINPPNDNHPDATTVCTTLFIYYLFSQLGFSISDIINAGDATLAGVYKNLTGDTSNPFPNFKQLLDRFFPGTATIQGDNRDNPFPLGFKSPVLIQSRFGHTGNFELIVPMAKAGLEHYMRDNDNPNGPWHGPIARFGETAGKIDAVSMIESNFGTTHARRPSEDGDPGNFEVIARTGDQLVFFYRESGPTFTWNGPFPLKADGVTVSGVSGNPVLIQSRFGNTGNFELIVPLVQGGLAHYWRDNDKPNLPWHGPTVFGETAGKIDAVTMIESNFGTTHARRPSEDGDPGNFEVIARIGDQLVFFYRESGTWNGPFPLKADGVTVSGVSGNPVLIQSRFGNTGNFELIVPLVQGGLAHYWRDNDKPDLPWHGPIVFANTSDWLVYDGVTMIESNYGTTHARRPNDDGDPGNLEVMGHANTPSFSGKIDDGLQFSWRNSGPTFTWNGPFPLIADGITLK
ncbi:hypothetical protein P4J00_23770 [Bacillus cereus]|nr:hypothetical protein [Bacillus cereus]